MGHKQMCERFLTLPFGIVLLVFLGDNTHENSHSLQSTITMTISSELGDEYMLDRIEYFPLFPRFTADKEVNHEWCRNQYLTGDLSRKASDEVFCCISQLRGSVLLN